jgi:transcriptional regulator NrdR family protein
MAKYLKGIRDINNPQIMECPYCGRVMFVSTESSYTQEGYRKLRYRRTTTCPECEGKFAL